MRERYTITDEIDVAILSGLKTKDIAKEFNVPERVISNRKRELKGKPVQRVTLKDDFGGAF